MVISYISGYEKTYVNYRFYAKNYIVEIFLVTIYCKLTISLLYAIEDTCSVPGLETWEIDMEDNDYFPFKF